MDEGLPGGYGQLVEIRGRIYSSPGGGRRPRALTRPYIFLALTVARRVSPSLALSFVFVDCYHSQMSHIGGFVKVALKKPKATEIWFVTILAAARKGNFAQILFKTPFVILVLPQLCLRNFLNFN